MQENAVHYNEQEAIHGGILNDIFISRSYVKCNSQINLIIIGEGKIKVNLQLIDTFVSRLFSHCREIARLIQIIGYQRREINCKFEPPRSFSLRGL